MGDVEDPEIEEWLAKLRRNKIAYGVGLTTEVCRHCGEGPLKDCGSLGWCREYERNGDKYASWYCPEAEFGVAHKHQPTDNEIAATIQRLQEAQDEQDQDSRRDPGVPGEHRLEG